MICCLLIVIVLGAGWVDTVQAAEISVADSIRKYRFLAKTSRDKKEYSDAIRYYREYLKHKPDDVKAHFFLGETCYKVKDFAGAKQALSGAVALDSLHINSNLRLYALYIGDDRADSAAQCLERVLEVKPDDVNKRRSLADLYRREGQIVRAIAHYEQIVEKVAEEDELIKLIAVLYEDLGQADRALEWRQRLLDNGEATTSLDGQRESLETMVRLQLETGDVKGAFNALLQLAGIDSVNRYSYFSQIVTLAEERGDKRMQLRGWEGMVLANPRDLETVAALVEWHLNKENIEPANYWLERGLRVDANDAHLLLLKGDILVLREDEEGAIAAFEQAKTDPRWAEIAQQRIWQLRPPETEEEKLRKAFFGKDDGEKDEKDD